MDNHVIPASQLQFKGERYLHRLARRLYLRGDINEFDMEETVEDLDLIAEGPSNGEWIELHLQTPGGDVHAGLEFIKAMKRAQKNGWKIRGIVDGVAMSMGFNILQYCDERIMSPGDMLMAHGVVMFSFFGQKDERDGKAELILLEYWKNFFVDHIVGRKTKGMDSEIVEKEQERWSKILEDKVYTFFNPTEALSENLIDRIEK